MTSDMIRRFNRDTAWVATGVLGVVILAALLLAVQERHPSAAAAIHSGNDLFLNVNSATMGGVIANSSSGKMTPEPENGGSPETPPQDTAMIASPPEMNHQDAQQTTASWAPQMPQNIVRVIRPKVRKLRDRFSSAIRTVDVKRRLIALWHQSLAESAKSRSWTAFSSLSVGIRKKAAYTAETNR